MQSRKRDILARAVRILCGVVVAVWAGNTFWSLGKMSLERPPPGFDPTRIIGEAMQQAIADTPAILIAAASVFADVAGQFLHGVMQNPALAQLIAELPPVHVLLVAPLVVVLVQVCVSVWVLMTRTKSERGWRGAASLNIVEPRAIFVYGAAMWVAVLVTTAVAARSGVLAGAFAFLLGLVVKQCRWISGYPLLFLETVAKVDFPAQKRALSELRRRMSEGVASRARDAVRPFLQQGNSIDSPDTAIALERPYAGNLHSASAVGGKAFPDLQTGSEQPISYQAAMGILGLDEACSKEEARSAYSTACLAIRNAETSISKATLNLAWTAIKQERGWR